MKISRHGIWAAGVERVAAADPLKGEPKALESAVFFNRLKGVVGAGGEKTAAVPHKRAENCLINPYEKQYHPLHSSFYLGVVQFCSGISERSAGKFFISLLIYSAFGYEFRKEMKNLQSASSGSAR